MAKKRWTILDYDTKKTHSLQKALGININLCKILVQRGYENFELSKAFFRPDIQQLHDPFLLKDMNKAVERIAIAKEKGERILIFGDYDVDGTTAVALMYQYLCNIIHPNLLDFYVPHRYTEGYGVSKKGIDHAASIGATLIISLDCGIKSVELVDYAKSIGIDFIICDHHLPDEKLPNAVAVLNAKQVGCAYPFKELCGCGVGFKLATALSQHFGLPRETHLQYLDLVAVAIAADIVPMVGENRILAYYGLQKINTDPQNGIKALQSLAQTGQAMDISKVVFMIAPRVNAAGRMDDATKAVKMFVEPDELKAKELAEVLHADNKERKEVDKSITEEALEILAKDERLHEKKTNVVYKENWLKGVVGIVASRIIETHYKPTIVLTRSGDYITGSARSIPGFNLYEAIYQCREYLVNYGGHFAAAGLTLHHHHLEAFKEKFDAVVHQTIDEKYLTRELIIDAEIGFADITPSFFNIINQMEPFGPENMRPVFLTRNISDTGYSKVVKEVHLRLVVQQENITFTGIAFSLGEKIGLLKSGKPLDLVYTIEENEWNGNKNLQLMVQDIRIAEQPL